jgi:hypothetical protein
MADGVVNLQVGTILKRVQKFESSWVYTARDSKIGSADVEQPLHLRPACIDKLFKFICFKRRLRLAQIQSVSLASPNF